MDRSWYLRFGFVVLIALGGLVVLWPTAYTIVQGEHRVRQGETLRRIAAQRGVSVQRLAALNDIPRNAELERGQVLRVPGWLPAPEFILEHVDRRITPGLDIQGGLRMMYTVDMDAAVEDLRNARAQRLSRLLGEKMDIIEEDEAPDEQELSRIRQRVRVGSRPSDAASLIRVVFTNEDDVALLDRDMLQAFGDEIHEVGRDARSVTLEITETRIDTLRELAVAQAQETIKNRISEMGLSESSVRAQDIDIIVEVPGASEQQFQRIRDLISQTARLEFKIVDEAPTFVSGLTELPAGISKRQAGAEVYLYASGPGACPEGVRSNAPENQCTARARLQHYVTGLRDQGRVPEGRVLSLAREEEEGDGTAQARRDEARSWRTYLLYELPPNGSDAVGGEHLEDASVGNDPETGRPLVLFSMNTEGARLMQELTSANMRKRMAIVLDEEVQSAPVIQGRISSSGQITLGSLSDYATQLDEARDLAIVLRAGALPAPIIAQNEQLIGPTLGRDSVKSGLQGAVIGILLVVVFMLIYYQVAGVVADIMVLFNVFLLFAIMAFFNNDLTLPGIAGIALTVGMAVDANVLITERMREELRMGKSARAAVDQGFRRAFWAIFDGQLTTAIAAVVLLQYGSAEIQGFGRTLLIGIVTSLFTSVFCSRVMFDWLVRGLKVKRLRVG